MWYIWWQCEGIYEDIHAVHSIGRQCCRSTTMKLCQNHFICITVISALHQNSGGLKQTEVNIDAKRTTSRNLQAFVHHLTLQTAEMQNQTHSNMLLYNPLLTVRTQLKLTGKEEKQGNKEDDPTHSSLSVSRLLCILHFHGVFPNPFIWHTKIYKPKL